MGNDENWVRSLRAAAREYEVAPPAGLWAEIEAGLSATDGAVRPVWFLRYRRAVWTAAACAVLAALSTIYYICGSGGRGEDLPLITQETVVDDIKEYVSVSNDDEAAPVAVLREDKSSVQDAMTAAESGEAPLPASGQLAQGYAEFSYYERVVVMGDDSDVVPNGSVMVSAATDVKVSEDKMSGPVVKKSSRGLGGALYATASLPKSPYGIPAGVGAAIEIPLSDRLNLETGVEYTGMKAGLSTDNYLGVPVRVKYDVYENPHVRLYASAGGAVEKSLDTRDVQLSLGAALGAEFSVSDDWGVFIEPSVEYYPGNGSNAPTIYKERSVAPEVRVGFRHTFRQ